MSEKFGITGKQFAIFVVTCITAFFAPTFGCVNAIVSLMPDAYGVSAASASWITTIGSVTSPIAAFIAGIVIGTKISYRWTGILMTLGFTIFGVIPFVFPGLSWGALLASRAAFGFCMGFFNTWANSIICRMAKNESVRASMLGVNSIMFSIGGSIGNIAVGALALKTWQTGFLFYGICVVALIACIFVVKDAYIVGDEEVVEDDAPAPEKVSFGEAVKHMPGSTWGFIISFVICTCLTSGWFGYVGFAMVVSGANPLLIGTVMTAFTIAGAIAAAAFAAFWKAFRAWNYPITYLLFAVGMILILIGFRTGITALFFASAIFVGIACCINGISMTMIVSNLVAPLAITFAMGCVEVTRNLGSFLATPWLLMIGKLFGDNPNSQYMGLLVLSIVGAVIGFILAAAARKRIAAAEAEKAPEEEAAA